MNPALWLTRAARARPGAPALFQGRRLVADYQSFAARAASVGGALAARHGVRPGDRVGVFMRNAAAYLEALYGIWFAGAAAVPVNAKLHPKEAAWILAHARAETAFVDATTSEGLEAALVAVAPERPVALLSTGPEAFAAMVEAVRPPAPAPMAPEAMAPEAMAWLFYTSGTTGRPKGVMISAANIQAMALSYFADVEAVGPGDGILYAAPMSHGAGLYNFMHVMKGAPHLAPESGGFDPAEIFDLADGRIEGVESLSMFAAPTMVRRLLDYAKAMDAPGDVAPALRTIVYGGGPMYLADIEEAVARLGPRFAQIYGQGECPMSITALSRAEVADRVHPRWRERLGSVGRAQSVAEVRVVDADGRDQPPGETGEILAKGPNVMLGYWDNPDATAETIRDGWLWTGDRGALDGEGYLTLKDRSKDLIISGGTNIYPREIEEVLLRLPEVAEAAVVGRPHAEWGEEVVAFVAATPGAAPTAAALDAACLAELARFKRPKAYRFLESLPKNNYGKVLKTALRARLAAEEAEPRG